MDLKFNKNAQLVDQYGNPLNSAPQEAEEEEVASSEEEWPIIPQPAKGADKFWEWLGNVADLIPPNAFANSMRIQALNLRRPKFAGWNITDAGNEKVAEPLPKATGDNALDRYLIMFLKALKEFPGSTLEHMADAWSVIVEKHQPALLQQVDLLSILRQGAEEAVNRGYATLSESPMAEPAEGFDLPGNLPDGVARRLNLRKKLAMGADNLNLRKKSYEVDAQISPELEVLNVEVQSYIADRIWDVLGTHYGIVPGTLLENYTIELVPGHISFNMDNPEIFELFAKAFTEWLNYDAEEEVQSNSELTADLYTNALNSLKAGYA